MSKNESRTMTRTEHTFIACSDAVLEMTSINLCAQRGEQPLQLVWNRQRGLWGRLWFGLFGRFVGCLCRLGTHRRRR